MAMKYNNYKYVATIIYNKRVKLNYMYICYGSETKNNDKLMNYNSLSKPVINTSISDAKKCITFLPE